MFYNLLLTAFRNLKRNKFFSFLNILGLAVGMASVGNIATMLSKDFLRLILISIVIASPLTWLVMNMWLRNFAYRIEISWWVFAIAGTAALTIALTTVSFQAIKAALTNPVKSLRTE